jgi:LPS-assembly protein
MGLDSTRGQAVALTYRTREDAAINELITTGRFKLTSNIFLSTYHDYSFEQQEFYQQAYGLTFQRGCWAVTFGYKREQDREWATVAVSLAGLGTAIGGGYSPDSGPFFSRGALAAPH